MTDDIMKWSGAILLVLTAWLEGSASPDTVVVPFHALTIRDGLSQGMVNHIHQDRFGFIWLATKDGLNRYDGSGFTVHRSDASDTTTISGNYVTVVSEDRSGAIWVGTASQGLNVFDPRLETFRRVRLGQEGDRSYVMQVVEDRDGNVWMAGNKGLFKITFAEPRGEGAGHEILPPYTVRRMFDRQCRIMIDRRGAIWGYLMSTGAFHIEPTPIGGEEVRMLDMDPVRSGPWSADRNTNVNGHFVEDPSTGRVYGVYPFFIAEYDTVTRVPVIVHQVPYPRGTRLETDQMVIDRNGSLWIGANTLWRFDLSGRRMELVTARDPNKEVMLRNVICTFEDRSGLIWMGTSGYGVLTYDPRIERFHSELFGSVHWMHPVGKDRVAVLRQRSFVSIYDRNDRSYPMLRSDEDPEVRALFNGPVEETHAMIQDGNGLQWLCKGDLMSFDPRSGRLLKYPITDASGNILDRRKSAFPVYQEDDRALWFGGDSAFHRFDKTTHRFRSFRYPITPVHIPYMFLQAIHQDRHGMFWLGTVSGLLRLDPFNGSWTIYRNDPNDPHSLSFDLIFSIHPDPSEPGSYLWIGTNGGGLNKLDMRTGRCERFDHKDGLANDVIYGILSDGDGWLWMSTNNGLSRFSPSTGVTRNYDESSGLQGDEFNRNAFCRLPDGTLFFGGVNGFNYFHPDEIREDRSPVHVLITDVRLLNRSIQPGVEDSPLELPAYRSNGMRIPYSANMVSFQFATMEFTKPERHRYRYMLKGFDPDWIDAGSNNTAIYTNLDPGSYTFLVKGVNDDGFWNADATSFSLVVLPPWWRTWWFYSILAVLTGGALIFYSRMIRWQKVRLENTVWVRTMELSREKDRSDELLRNILPAEVASELKALGRTRAKYFDQATILFSDFQGFTELSGSLSPAELVEELNVCFKAFDRIMEKHRVEKIKTIGDSYMAAGGVPDPRAGAPEDVVMAALEMQEIMEERKQERQALGKQAFEMRVGIHTGPVVAGIVGLKKFQYDIWGDTVNIASRMETNGQIGKVNISERTHALVREKEGFSFIPRGRVMVKGKGGMEMYFVERNEPAPLRSVGRVEISGSPRSSGSNRKRASAVRHVELKDLRILLAEDNEFNMMVAQDELLEAVPGVVLDIAVNGREAVEKVEKGDHDLVLMDVQMPLMNGYEATRAIRGLDGGRGRVPIVAMTANTMKAEVDRCMASGMDGFVAKPFRREELIDVLKQVLMEHGADNL